MGDPAYTLSTELGAGSVIIKSHVDAQLFLPPTTTTE
jgi:hypothetical protein